MKRELTFHPEVVEDIKGSYNWYEERLQGLGSGFLNELEDGYTAIQNFPETWATFHYGFKSYILNRFPFSILYQIMDEKIFIIAVMHNSRKPNYWLDRIKK